MCKTSHTPSAYTNIEADDSQIDTQLKEILDDNKLHQLAGLRCVDRGRLLVLPFKNSVEVARCFFQMEFCND